MRMTTAMLTALCLAMVILLASLTPVVGMAQEGSLTTVSSSALEADGGVSVLPSTIPEDPFLLVGTVVSIV